MIAEPHTVGIGTTLRPGDALVIEELARRHNVSRNRVLSRIVENARARGLLNELAALSNEPQVG